MGQQTWQKKTALLIAVAVLAAGAGVLTYATHLLKRSELQSIDARFSIRGAQRPPANFVLVEVDNATFQELTNLHLHSEFPFPRRYDAQVIDRLRLAGARTIAMDLEFAHPTDERDDNALIEAIGRARGKVVLAATEVGRHGSTGVLGGGKPRKGSRRTRSRSDPDRGPRRQGAPLRLLVQRAAQFSRGDR